MYCVWNAGGKLFTIVYVLVGLVYVMGVLVDGTNNIMTKIEQFIVQVDGETLSWKVWWLRRLLWLPCACDHVV
jgi:hypothetical protein